MAGSGIEFIFLPGSEGLRREHLAFAKAFLRQRASIDNRGRWRSGHIDIDASWGPWIQVPQAIGITAISQLSSF